jgi:hypothetical protein
LGLGLVLLGVVLLLNVLIALLRRLLDGMGSARFPLLTQAGA